MGVQSGGSTAAPVRMALMLGLAPLATLPGLAYAGAGEACRDQAAIVEHAAGIPPGLLLAIGKRESGRWDAQTGGVLPWPWTVNREGEDHIFELRDEAVAYVAAAQREGSRSIDVGCFQINLMYHPAAFATLEEAFDPTANAAYAARFLIELHDRAGNWETAVADYHSATPWLGTPYREAVFATWHGLAEPAAPVIRQAIGPARGVPGIRVWVAGTPPLAPPPASAVAAAPVTSLRVTAIRVTGRSLAGLPRVITPSVTLAQNR